MCSEWNTCTTHTAGSHTEIHLKCIQKYECMKIYTACAPIFLVQYERGERVWVQSPCDVQVQTGDKYIRAELFEIQEIQKQKQMSIKIHRFLASRHLKENCILFSLPLTKTLQQKRCLQVWHQMAKTLKQQNKSCQQFQSLVQQ